MRGKRIKKFYEKKKMKADDIKQMSEGEKKRKFIERERDRGKEKWERKGKTWENGEKENEKENRNYKENRENCPCWVCAANGEPLLGRKQKQNKTKKIIMHKYKRTSVNSLNKYRRRRSF